MPPPVIKKPQPEPKRPPVFGTKKKVADFLPAPPARKVAVPTIYRRAIAGVELSRKPGDGERRLDAICRAQGWTWALVCTRDHDTNQVTTTILVGTLFEGTAELVSPPSLTDQAGAWCALDEALLAIATNLEASYAPPTGA